MNSLRMFALIAWTLCWSGVTALRAAEPIALEAASIIDVHSTPEKKSDLRYYGQPAKDGVIDLTAGNGFFDRCFQATESLPGPATKPFFCPEFKSLVRSLDQDAGTARWHLWCAAAGEIQAKFWLTVPAGEANHEWTIRVGEETHTLHAAASDGATAQPQVLKFNVKAPGRVTLVIDCTKTTPPVESKLHFIRLSGSSIDKSHLLRTRWRPTAVHTHLYAPSECPDSQMWVFETRCVLMSSSYSPITTGFGYFGTSFQDDGKIKPGAGFNFSMWAANGNAQDAPPLDKMPRLIGTAVEEAEFSTFGGEGTGVKFRRAVAYPDGAERTIQALRIEPTKEGLLTFYGYFYDEKLGQWRLYASAQKPAKNAKTANSPNFGTMRGTGSFCEIPGPPARERSGDVVREIKRRGWFYGRDGQWYPANLGDVLKEQKQKSTAEDNNESDDGPITDKHAYYMADYAVNGWMSMATGGIEYHVKTDQRQFVKAKEQPALPDYLTAAHTKELFALPVEFGEATANEVTANSATIDYPLKKTGPNSQGILYYGTVDCVTYPAKDLKNGSPAELAMASPERTWQAAIPAQKVAGGPNKFQLSDLKKNTTYYYRLYVEHDAGKSWDYRSGSFTTK